MPPVGAILSRPGTSLVLENGRAYGNNINGRISTIAHSAHEKVLRVSVFEQ